MHSDLPLPDNENISSANIDNDGYVENWYKQAVDNAEQRLYSD